MKLNAYILARTMNRYDDLLGKLDDKNFEFEKDEHGNARVAVPFSRFEKFAKIMQAHLNAPFNYVDISYPEEKKLAIVFGAKTFVISNQQELARAKKWAIDLGLPPAEADLNPDFLNYD